jgi:ElaB/YqjD/DUF883 family membrane-anchored ribosome-binding protein
MSVAHACGDVAADLWRATACAAANGVSGMKSAKAPTSKTKERRMATNGHKDSERKESTTTDRFAAKAHETVDTIAERAQRAEREVRGAAARTAEQAREFHEQAAERAEQTIRRAGSYVESNPLAFVGIAFAAGVLLSTLLRR